MLFEAQTEMGNTWRSETGEKTPGRGSETSTATGIESQISQTGQTSTRAWSAAPPAQLSSAKAPWAARKIGAQSMTNAMQPVEKRVHPGRMPVLRAGGCSRQGAIRPHSIGITTEIANSRNKPVHGGRPARYQIKGEKNGTQQGPEALFPTRASAQEGWA